MRFFSPIGKRFSVVKNFFAQTVVMGWVPLFVFILVLGLALVDLGLVVFTGTGGSVSNFLINAGFNSPLFTFAVGCTVGHLYFYMTPVDQWGTPTYNSWLKKQALTIGCSCLFYEGLRRVVIALFHLIVT